MPPENQISTLCKVAHNTRRAFRALTSNFTSIFSYVTVCVAICALSTTLNVTAQGISGNWFQVEAEDYDAQSGTQLQSTGDTGGGNNVAYISDGNWLRYNGVTLGDNTLLNFRIARNSGTDASHIEVRIGSQTGTLIGQVDVPETGGWQTWETVSIPVSPVVGQQDIFLVFVETGTTNGDSLFNLNWWSKTALVEAENFTAGIDYRFETTQDIGGGQNLGWISDGEWMEYTIEVETPGWHKVDLRVAGDNSDGSINLISEGKTIGSVEIGDSGGWQTWKTVSAYVEFQTTGTQTLRLEFVVPSASFNFNWFSYEETPEPLSLVVGNTPQQKMRYGMDYERLWYWTGGLNNSERDRIARWSVVDADVDFVRVAVNSKYELNEGTYDLGAYTEKIIPLMQEMQQANPNIKFFASPRPLNEAVSNAVWQPYPIWITDISPTTSDPASYTSQSFDFGWQKCSEYLVRYLLLMKSYGFKISFLDVTNEWQSNVGGGLLTQDDMDHIHEYLNVTYFDDPWSYSGVGDTLFLEPADIPEIIAPSSWNYSQGTSWINNLDTGDKEAISIAASHNTDRGGSAKAFADKVKEELGNDTEIWNTELHGWKSTSNENETTSFYYYLEAIRAGFGGINGWLAIGTTGQGHSYILNPSGSPSRNVKYYIYRKLASTSNYGHALDIMDEPEVDVLNAPLGSNDDDTPRNVAAFIKGNLMTVWVVNENANPVPLDITPSGHTIATSSIRRTRWTDANDVEGFESDIPVLSETSVVSSIPGESVCCFEIVLDTEDFSNDIIQAEDYSHQWGTGLEDQGSYVNVASINDGDLLRYGSVALEEDSTLTFNVARPGGRPDSFIRIREGSADGAILGQVDVPETGNWQVYETIATTLDVEAGVYNLYLEFVEDGTSTNNAFVNIDQFSVNELPASNVAGSPSTASEVSLSWDAVSGGVIGYTVKRSTTQGGPYTVIDNTVTTTSFTDAGLTAGKKYYYVISARYSDSEGPNSEEITVVPSDPIAIETVNFSNMAMGSDGGSGEAFWFTIPNSVIGHTYQTVKKADLTMGDWIDAEPAQNGTGGPLQFSIPIGVNEPEYFYRVRVSRQ